MNEDAVTDYLDQYSTLPDASPPEWGSLPPCIPAPPGEVFAMWDTIPLWDVKHLRPGDVFGNWMFLASSPDWDTVQLTLTKGNDDGDLEPVEVKASEVWTTLTGLFGDEEWKVRRMFVSDRVVLIPTDGGYSAAGFPTA